MNMQEHHAGLYTCEATNSFGSSNHSAVIRIKTRPRWIAEPQDRAVFVGSPVLLECNAQSYPQPLITWMANTAQSGSSVHDKFIPVHMDGMRISQSPNGSLVIYKVQRSDAGWYRCQADNSVGEPLQKIVQLLVNAPAKVDTDSTTKNVHIGSTMMITCEASGDSPLTLEWLRHHSKLISNKRLSVSSSRR
ncbi:unnamed protein product, partial [Meganyctiphanes norvegica]